MASDETVVFSRSGYEYRYRIQMNDELLLSYHEQIPPCSRRKLLFEVRTNFISKPRVVVDAVDEITDSEMMESERFADTISLSLLVEEKLLLGDMWYRLSEYWLPEESIRRIAQEALRFVNRVVYDPEYDNVLKLVPVVLEIDVCTVQLQGESLDETIRRSIRPNCLSPVRLWGPLIMVPGDELVEGGKKMCWVHRSHLMKLPKERVEDHIVAINASARMELCPICWEAPAYGAQLTPLPCDHVFHYHCIVRWLMNTKTCPMCRSVIKYPKRKRIKYARLSANSAPLGSIVDEHQRMLRSMVDQYLSMSRASS